MPKKETLLKKLFSNSSPRDFTVKELDTLMGKCGCTKHQGGRGSGIRYVHDVTNRVLAFDGPHPGSELYGYQVKMVRNFLIEIGEV